MTALVGFSIQLCETVGPNQIGRGASAKEVGVGQEMVILLAMEEEEAPSHSLCCQVHMS